MSRLIHIKNSKINSTNNNKSLLIKKNNNIVKKNTHELQREIYISDVLLKIPHFFLYFQPIINHRIFQLTEIDDEKFENCYTSEHISAQYYLVSYVDREKIEGFKGFFHYDKDSVFSKKRFLYRWFETYKNLLEICNVMNKNNIINMDITPKNIFFQEGRPILYNVSRCIYLTNIGIDIGEKIDNISIQIFNEYNPRMLHLPLEYHILCYMEHSQYDSLSIGNIQTVVKEWAMEIRRSPLSVFFKNMNFDGVIFSLKNLVNKPKTIIKRELFGHIGTWNNYSISVIYLLFLSSLGELVYNSEFGIEFTKLLLKNISANKMERKSIADTYDIFNTYVEKVDILEWKRFVEGM
jgi:hypothetical protein